MAENTTAVPSPAKPLIVQGDRTILVEVASPRYPEARDALVRFAELVKSPEHVHTYRITALSIWNACAAGESAGQIIETLHSLSRYPVPEHIVTEITDHAARFGSITLQAGPAGLELHCRDKGLAALIASDKRTAAQLGERLSDTSFGVPAHARGRIKVELIRLGYPVDDRAGYSAAEPLSFALRSETLGRGIPFAPRPYQQEAAKAFHAEGSERGGSGVIVLPCGAGKTIVGMLCMNLLQCSTLVLTTCVTAVRQWIAELVDKTDIDPQLIGEYTGLKKEVRPITVSTYQMLTHREPAGSRASRAPDCSAPDGEPEGDPAEGQYPHMALFSQRDWGVIVYDEVHLLPAPVFQITASLQARRRLGLTATLVREDGKEDDVFALIGPKKFDVPWKEMEKQGWIAKAVCTEIRVPLPEDMKMSYALADARAKFRMASENPAKIEQVKAILAAHPGEPAIVIGMYLDQLAAVAGPLGLPVITGSTPQRVRDRLYDDFKAGRIPVLAVSKVANFAVDLPDASLAIQVSGTYGSRQEEAQRLGRILRPKELGNQAWFYTLVSRDTVEQDFALKRQLFLCEQGYGYQIRVLGAPKGRAAGEVPA
ncbi:MAG TPA: helicase-associated domain-containing protein [Spirochaetia bacterium]|nr:helicase-associated domain-containing protein [Spirochaetia bacterium]